MATIEERTADLANYRSQLDAKVQEYNQGKLDNLPVNEIDEIKEKIDELQKDHSTTARLLAYDKFKADPEGAMIAACRAATYDAVKVVEVAIDGTKEKRLEVQETQRKVDLGDLHKKLDGIGVDKKWLYATQKLNMMLTVRCAKDFGHSTRRIREINDSFRIEKLAQEYDLGKDPCTDTKILNTLRGIIAMMIGEKYDGRQAMKWDVVFLNKAWGRQDGKDITKIKAATNRQMYCYMMTICHRIITNGVYDVKFQEIKKK